MLPVPTLVERLLQDWQPYCQDKHAGQSGKWAASSVDLRTLRANRARRAKYAEKGLELKKESQFVNITRNPSDMSKFHPKRSFWPCRGARMVLLEL